MPRPKTRSDEQVLDAALRLMHEGGPAALTFHGVAEACGLSSSALVQRFGTKARLKQATLLRAWTRLDAETARLARTVPRTPEGAIALLVALSGHYGGIEAYAEGLLVLREDLRDPVLRSRGAAWKAALCAGLDRCFASTPGAPSDIGLLMASHWQGAVLWWSFDPREPVEQYVDGSLRRLVSALAGKGMP